MLYYALLWSQSSLGQFSEGLSAVGLLEIAKAHSTLMESLFVLSHLLLMRISSIKRFAFCPQL